MRIAVFGNISAVNIMKDVVSRCASQRLSVNILQQKFRSVHIRYSTQNVDLAIKQTIAKSVEELFNYNKFNGFVKFKKFCGFKNVIF